MVQVWAQTYGNYFWKLLEVSSELDGIRGAGELESDFDIYWVKVRQWFELSACLRGTYGLQLLEIASGRSPSPYDSRTDDVWM